MSYPVVNSKSRNHRDQVCGHWLQFANIPLLTVTVYFFQSLDIPVQMQEAVELILCDFFAWCIGGEESVTTLSQDLTLTCHNCNYMLTQLPTNTTNNNIALHS